jgi:hypothetical protein
MIIKAAQLIGARVLSAIRDDAAMWREHAARADALWRQGYDKLKIEVTQATTEARRARAAEHALATELATIRRITQPLRQTLEQAAAALQPGTIQPNDERAKLIEHLRFLAHQLTGLS